MTRPDTDWLDRLQRVRPVQLFALTVAASYFWTIHYGAFTALGVEPSNLARSLITSGAYSDPFLALPTGPSAHMPPLFPLYMALTMKLSGAGVVMATTILHILALGVHAVLLPKVSALLLGDRRPGIAAALLVALLPVVPLHPEWEAWMAAIGFMAFLLLCGTGAAVSAVRLLAIGLALGLLALLQPPVAAVAALYPLLVWRRMDGWGSALVRTVVIGGIALAVVSPWMVRNWRVLHEFVPMRSNAGMELYVANSDCAAPGLMENLRNGCNKRMHPSESVTEAAEVARLGEVAYNRDRMARAKQWIAAHRERFIELTALRVAEYWFPRDPARSFSVGCIWLVTLISLPGVWRVMRSGGNGRFIALVFLLFPLTFYMIQLSPRHRTPILWLTLLGAGQTIVMLLGRRRANQVQ